MPAADSTVHRPYVGAIVHVRDWDGYCVPAIILAVYRDDRDLPVRLRLRVLRITPIGAEAGSGDDEYPMSEPGAALGAWHWPERPSSADERPEAAAAAEPVEPDWTLR